MTAPDYAVAWSTAARRAIATMPEKVATAAIEFIYATLAANPERVGKPLRLELEGLRSARRGDYRAIYRIDERRHQNEIIAIEHRADVYRPGRHHPRRHA